MIEATLWFDPELKDLLKIIPAGNPFTHRWTGRRSVKDLIESLGVPHVEVDLILVNQQPVGFEYVVLFADAIEVYGDSKRAGRADEKGLRSSCPGQPRFVCDVHLGKLARRLRLLGFDVDYRPDRGDKELALISGNERRFLLTRDLQLLKRGQVKWGIFIRSQDVDEQLAQVCQRMSLPQHIKPFSRCLSCNGELKHLDIGKIEGRQYLNKIPAKVQQWCQDYNVCTYCDKIYWPGTHFRRLRSWIKKICPQWPPDNGAKYTGDKE